MFNDLAEVLEDAPRDWCRWEADELGAFNDPIEEEVLQRDRGVTVDEIDRLDELADDCAEDGKYDCCYVGTPPETVHGSGSPVNPIVIK